VDSADVCAEARGVRVLGDGDGNLDVVGCAAAFELGFCLRRGLVRCSKRGSYDGKGAQG
jgi:hypothetical protein